MRSTEKKVFKVATDFTVTLEEYVVATNKHEARRITDEKIKECEISYLDEGMRYGTHIFFKDIPSYRSLNPEYSVVELEKENVVDFEDFEKEFSKWTIWTIWTMKSWHSKVWNKPKIRIL